MAVSFNEIKWFNETRNGSNFLSNPSDYTTIFKANAGERVRLFLEFTFSNIFDFAPALNSLTFTVDSSTTDKITLSRQSWGGLGYKRGDGLELYDNKTNKIKAQATIDSIQGKVANVTITGLFVDGVYDDGQLRFNTELKKFQFDFDEEADLTGTRQPFNVFNTVQRYYNSVEVGTGGPRSTAWVDFIAREPNNFDTGSFRMRYVDDPQPFYQRFEVEHTFIVTPFHLEEFVYSPLTRPNEYLNGTLAYKFDLFNIENAFSSRRSIATVDEVGSVGWFNENFDGGLNTFALQSLDYYNVDDATAITKINTDVTTRVTAVITGNFLTTEPLTLYHTKAPSEAEYQNQFNDYTELWVEESLRNTIDGGTASGTIINNLDITLDSPTQITVVFELDYVGTELIVNGNDYLLYIALEDSTATPDDSNRVNLFLDFNQYLRSTDEPDLFILDKYEVYNHVKDLDVDLPSTDYEGYIEDGVLVDIEFRLKNDLDAPRVGNRERKLDDFYMCLVAYNTNDNTVFKLTSEAEFNPGNDTLKDGSFEYITGWINNLWRNADFNLENSDQFNLAHFDSPTVLTDISYVSNDGTHGLYRAKIGLKANWQESLQLNQNFRGGRVNNGDLDEYHTEVLGVPKVDFADVKDFGFWFDSGQIHGGLNKILSKYKIGDWIIKPLIAIERDNLIDTTEKTTYLQFMPEWVLNDYDTNSDYTGTVVTEDENAVDLGGSLVRNETNKITITFDDGNTKTDTSLFEAIVRLEKKNQSGYDIHELSTLRNTYTGNILQGFGTGGTKAEKSIVAGNYTVICELDGTLLDADLYKITGRLFDLEYDPTKDANLIAWYDASGLVTNTDNAYGTVNASDEVSNWKNRIGNTDWDLLQSTGANQPDFDTINFKLDFDGIAHFMYWLDNDLGSEYTVFMVAEFGAGYLGTERDWINYVDGSEVTQYQEEIFIGQNGDPDLLMHSYDGGVQVDVEAPTLLSGKKVMQFSFKDGDDWYMKVNDFRYDTPDGNQNTPTISDTDNILLLGASGLKNGGSPTITSYGLGQFYEIMIYPNQSVLHKETAIHNYLKAKWGVL